MTFNSIDELKQYMLAKCEDAIVETQQKIYEILYGFVAKFYGEYEPRVYERTEQYYKSLVVSKIIPTGNGYTAHVYFDINKMNHPKSSWDEEKILETGMEGEYPHGDYAPAGGTGIWVNAVPEITNEAYQYLKKALIDNGIPIE